MSARLEALRAERDAIEAADQWDHPALDWLSSEIEKLEAAERAKPSAARAPAQPVGPESDLVAKLIADMQRAAANMDRLTDQEAAELLGRYNALAAASQAQPETVDFAKLQRDMTIADADPDALSEEQRTELMARWNRAARQRQPAARADSPDLHERMLAALEAHERGEDVPDELVSRLTGADFLAWQEQRLAAERDPANLPPELQEQAKVLYAAEAAMHRPADPVDAALADLRTYVASMRPPTLEKQLEALGVEPDPELGVQAEQVSTSQEA